ncbi:hypothetical protein B7494_g5983 [Chlorociboria aeruginascens]|nr:hypothetical protein B7494_g5983 [Chlorociboria aeruginascens]
MPNIVVVGNPEYKITVLAKHMPGDYDIEYASPWAGANYMPYIDLVLYNRSKDVHTTTGQWLKELVSPTPWFASVVPDFRVIPKEDLPSSPAGIDSATAFTSVCINTAVYLPYLVSQCLKHGVIFKRSILTHISHASALHHTGLKADVVVNCTGLLASKLGGVMDKEVIPARGQTVLVRNEPGIIVSVSGTDDAEDECCYIMQRAAGGGTILGGTYMKGSWESQPDPNQAVRIMQRAVELCPQLTGGKGIEALSVIRHGVSSIMLHEILLSLSGHPSPLLTADHSSPTSILSPPEKALLSSVAHLSNLHCKLLTHTATIASTHPSSICQAVATAIRSTHLARFQRKVLEVEDSILRKDAGSVGAYNIVPLTAIVGQFSEWTRRMEWFLEIAEFMMREIAREGKNATGAMLIDRLSDAIQTGYVDIEEAALSLVKIAETTWLKQVSAWILYGRLPSFGMDDFFVQQVIDGDIEEYESKRELLPAFVSTSTASSLLFIGRSLNHIRVKSISSSTSPELGLLSSHLRQLSTLNFPINSAGFSRVISSIRLSLSQTTLQKLLPLSKVVEILSVLREFFLLGRGEFAIALITEADEKIRSRWRRADNLAYDKRDGVENIAVKEGEVSAVLARTWAAMGALQSQNQDQDEDEQLELARDLIQLTITKSTPTSSKQSQSSSTSPTSSIAATPFRNLLLSVPVVLNLNIPSPLDLFLTPADVQTYSSINAYLLSIHRAHLRLTDLWKITSLRRHHPPPPGPPYGSSIRGREKVHILRERAKERSAAMRSVWATSSAAVFFLAETQAYLQGEVVQGTWLGFQKWLSGESSSRPPSPSYPPCKKEAQENFDEEDIWLQAGKSSPLPQTQTEKYTHDPQTLASAHRRYLSTLSTNLLLTQPSFTHPLYTLLQQIDNLVALVHRMHSIWNSLDLESDEGVVDAFSDFRKEEGDVRSQLRLVADKVRAGIEVLVNALRDMDGVKVGWEFGGVVAEGGDGEWLLGDREEGEYRPRKVGRVDRLLMKLDFGGWFDSGITGEGVGSSDEGDYEL